MENRIELRPEDFGPFQKYIEQETVTDIDYEANEIWITDLKKGVYKVEDAVVEPEFVVRFKNMIANKVNKQFNQTDNVLEAETEDLRIEMVDSYVCRSGLSITTRKTPVSRRLTPYLITETAYMPTPILMFLANCVEAQCNFAFCGKPGVGKTELLKTMTSYIPANQKAIIIEDNPEIHYGEINPGKFRQELKIDMDTGFDYTKAIKTALRLNPEWLILSEARSREVSSLIEGWSTGISGMTTLHVNDIRQVPDRIVSMAGVDAESTHLKNMVFESLDVGVLIRRKYDPRTNETIRSVDQVCLFSRDSVESGMVNHAQMIVSDGKCINYNIPDGIAKKLKMAGINKFFVNDKVQQEIERERHEAQDNES